MHTLTHPNGITLTQSYEPQRNLLTEMAYTRGNAATAHRSYTYDAIGRPTLRNTQRSNETQDDSFAYNNRSELVAASLGDKGYAYTYDNIGNRESDQEAAEEVTQYESNALNQYTAVGDFTPEFDPAGNQTLVKTTTGIWRITYNAENRAEQFVCIDRDTVIKCTYDTMGRRATKKVTTNGKVTLHQRYIYRSYLQIAACDLTRATSPCLWHLLWDPTQPIATRPLAIQKDGTWYTYGWDLTKNIYELYDLYGDLRTAYTYAPYGEIASDGDVTQPIQWSSEFSDSDLGLVYYNYRYYNPTDGRWTRRDPLREITGLNIFDFVLNSPIYYIDSLGLYAFILCERIRPQGGVSFFYKCHIYIYEPCSDECCKKEIQAAGAAQNKRALTEALAQLRNCIAKNNAGRIKVTIKQDYYSNMGKNEMSISPKDPYGKKGPLPEGTYRILPRAKSGENYPKGTPAITGLNQKIPGNVRTPKGTDRSALLIHGAGRSEGCLSMECGAQDEIKRIMDQNTSCGGTYLRIVGK